jgi:diacylglycerol kinase family enzyme
MEQRNVVFFINRKSGGRGGSELLETVRSIKDSYFGEKVTVFDILEFAAQETRELRIGELKQVFVDVRDDEKQGNVVMNYVVIAGGDGTIKWGIEIISALELPDNLFPKLAVIPLGTANELARVTGWRIRTRPRRTDFKKFMNSLFTGNWFFLDQWNYSFFSSESDENPKQQNIKMICFASIGFDAKVAHKFHIVREKKPHLADSVFKNKFWYGYYGFKRLFSKRSPVSNILKVECDGVEVKIPDKYQSLQVFNISTAADGIYFWGEKKSKKSELQDWTRPSLNDQTLEVASLKNIFHLLCTKFKLNHSFRISQCKNCKISILQDSLIIQVDGEAWPIKKGEILISHDRQIPMIQGPYRTFNIGSFVKAESHVNSKA